MLSRRRFLENSVKGLFSLEVARRIPPAINDLFKSRSLDFPLYELTQKQRDFIKENNINTNLRKYSGLFFENAEDIRKGNLAGSPLEDILKIMDEEKIFFDTSWDMVQLTKNYGGDEKEIKRIFAIYGLQIIDGLPKFVPMQKGLKTLKETGLLETVDKLWKSWFNEESKEKLRVKRQSGQLYSELDESSYPLLFVLNTPISEYGGPIQRYISQHEEVNLEEVLGTMHQYIDTRLFEEISQKYKLVKYPKYLELKTEPKQEGKNINSFISQS